MQTVRLPFTDDAIHTAAAALKDGQVVAFPTETVYGLGANGLDAAAVTRIFQAKERPCDNPLILHIDTLNMAYPLAHVTEEAKQLAAAFWPGPLTMLLKKKPAVPDTVTAGLDTVALRMPDHPVALALIAACGLPLAAPSANRSGRPSPTLSEHVMEDMQGRIPYILEGGASMFGVESTVVDLTHGTPMVLRPGAVTAEQIAMVLGSCDVADSILRPLKEGEHALSPGMKHRHYAPQAEMTLYEGEAEHVAQAICAAYDAAQNACILCMEENLPRYGTRRAMCLGKDAPQAAHRLFYLLREMDSLGVQSIFCETLPLTGLGLAVMNRLKRAASFRTVAV